MNNCDDCNKLCQQLGKIDDANVCYNCFIARLQIRKRNAELALKFIAAALGVTVACVFIVLYNLYV